MPENQVTSATFSAEGRLRKVAVLGARGVGKTSLTNRFCEGAFYDSYLPTIEDTYHASTKVNNVTYNCEIMDTAGQDEYSILGTQLTIGIHGYLLVFSLRDISSFELLRTINEKLLSTLGIEHIPRVLVANQADSPKDEWEVELQQALDFASKDLKCQLIQCSAKTGTNVEQAFHCLIKNIETAKGTQVQKQDNPCVIV